MIMRQSENVASQGALKRGSAHKAKGGATVLPSGDADVPSPEGPGALAQAAGLPRFLPWHADTARHWLGQRERFAHAWLIHGLAGIGKVEFALAAAASLLCESPHAGLACGTCAACTWFASGNHPDVRRIRPEAIALEEGVEAQADAAPAATATSSATQAEAGKKRAPSREIRIEQIRSLASWFNTATHRGGWRVAGLYPAHAMNIISANALLKVLEEPPARTVFLLVADAPDRLLPTLVSRCRRLPLAAPTPSMAQTWLHEQGVTEAAAWLAAAGGAPLAALHLSQQRAQACPDWLARFLAPLSRANTPDLGELVDILEKLPAMHWLDTLQRLFVDLMLLVAGADARYFPAQQAVLQAIAARAHGVAIAETARWLSQQRALVNHPLNAKLFIHAALQRASSACRS